MKILTKYLSFAAVIAAFLFMVPSCFSLDDPGQGPDKDIDYEWDSNVEITGPQDFPKAGPDSTVRQLMELMGVNMMEEGVEPLPGGFWDNLGSGMLDLASGVLKAYFNQSAIQVIKGLLYGSQEDPVSQKLDIILDRLKSIDTQLKAMAEMMCEIREQLDEVEINEFRLAFQTINDQFTGLRNANALCMSELKKDGLTDDQLIEVVNKWAATTVNGNPAYLATLNYASSLLNFSFTYHKHPLNICSVYDLITYDTTPWELVGYDYREMFRAANVAELIRGLYLSYMYFAIIENEYFQMEAMECMDTMMEFFKLNEVQRDEEHAICQIKGAHVIFNRENCISERHGWSMSSAQWLNSDQFLAASGNNIVVPSSSEITAYKNSLLKQSEVNALINYYSGSLGKQCSFLEFLKEGGVVIPEELIGKYKKETISVQDISIDVVTEFAEFYMPTYESTVTCKMYLPPFMPAYEWDGKNSLSIDGLYLVSVPTEAMVFVGLYGSPNPKRPWTEEIVYAKNDMDCKDVWKTEGEYKLQYYKNWKIKSASFHYPFEKVLFPEVIGRFDDAWE